MEREREREHKEREREREGGGGEEEEEEEKKNATMGFPPTSPSGSSFVLPCLRKLRSFDVYYPSKGMLLGTLPPMFKWVWELCAMLCIFKRAAICRCWCSPSCTIAFPRTSRGA